MDGRKQYRLALEFIVEAGSIDEAIETGADILECSDGKATLLHGDLQLADQGFPVEEYHWGALGQEPFRNMTATRSPAAVAGGQPASS